MGSSPDNKLSNNQLSLFEKQRALEALVEFVEEVNTIETIKDAVWHVAHHTIKALNFEDCVIYLFDEEKGYLVQVAAFGPKNPVRQEILNPITIKLGEGVVGKCAQSKTSSFINDTSEEPEYIIDDRARASELAVPILFRGKLLGVIDSEHSLKNFYTRDHLRYVKVLASVLASKVALEKNILQLEETLKEKSVAHKLSEAYFNISEITHDAQSPEEFYSQLHNLIRKQINTESFCIVLYDKEKNLYSAPFLNDSEHGSQLNFDLNLSTEQMQQTLVAEVIRKQSPLIADNKELQKRYQLGQTIRYGKIPYCWLAVPFEINPELSGAIALQSYDEKVTFSESDLNFLSFLSKHLSVAIDRNTKDQKLQYQAIHDSITGLANRSLFVDRIDHAYLRCQRNSAPTIAVLFIDFDNFKQINDSYGHAAGDLLLRETAQRMKKQLRTSDTLARIGGDEFAILLEDLDNTNFAITIAQRILTSMNETVTFGKQSIVASLSIGVAFNDENCESPQQMMKNADHAMYHAKRSGKNKIEVYESSLHYAVVYEKKLVTELEQAINNNELLFYYQPIVNLNDFSVAGFEALMRWDHPDKGIIAPGEFIGIAEQYDLIQAIDQKLLETAGNTLKKWRQVTSTPPYLTINISAQRFTDNSFVGEINDLIRKFSIPAQSLIIEVTEHLLMKNIAKARLIFHKLKSLGIKLSLDDFGTGYSSLSYLNQLPFDLIKVDRSFIASLNEKESISPIINAIKAMATSMELEWVAEGIETNYQLDALCKMKCNLGQGFYLAKPMPEKEALALVRKGKIDI
ncbi:GGDEF domain-containing protein [Aliikangiella sp. G2MR2-5]|uniref:bifunctional diguanylate cyclase/phosphodiesterase n=1 Tax=Aliikangiella sp. G2MR2-5 TaxID=2788943 RepID=UPI0018A9D129|nr:GGDEF domain-containing protein [Aliikangiella sp. G2MR2-5]